MEARFPLATPAPGTVAPAPDEADPQRARRSDQIPSRVNPNVSVPYAFLHRMDKKIIPEESTDDIEPDHLDPDEHS